MTRNLPTHLVKLASAASVIRLKHDDTGFSRYLKESGPDPQQAGRREMPSEEFDVARLDRLTPEGDYANCGQSLVPS